MYMIVKKESFQPGDNIPPCLCLLQALPLSVSLTPLSFCLSLSLSFSPLFDLCPTLQELQRLWYWEHKRRSLNLPVMLTNEETNAAAAAAAAAADPGGYKSSRKGIGR